MAFTTSKLGKVGEEPQVADRCGQNLEGIELLQASQKVEGVHKSAACLQPLHWLAFVFI